MLSPQDMEDLKDYLDIDADEPGKMPATMNFVSDYGVSVLYS